MTRIVLFIVAIISLIVGVLTGVILLITGFVPVIIEVLNNLGVINLSHDTRIGIYNLWGVLMFVVGLVIGEELNTQ